jgi:hypothetical protein
MLYDVQTMEPPRDEPLEFGAEEDAQKVCQMIGSLHGNTELFTDPAACAISSYHVARSHQLCVPSSAVDESSTDACFILFEGGQLCSKGDLGLSKAAGAFEEDRFERVLRTGPGSDRTHCYHFLGWREAKGDACHFRLSKRWQDGRERGC